MAHLNEQLQQEQSRKEQELRETRDTHQSQISSLQEKIANLVSAIGKMCLCLRCLNRFIDIQICNTSFTAY